MRKHNGLSTVVGMVFLAAVVVSSLSYVTYSMNVLGNFSESLIAEESRQKDQQNEQMEIVSVDITSANKLDAIVKNSGKVPLKVTTLWIEEQGVNDSVKKINVNQTIYPGNTINLYPTVDFDMDPIKGYNMKLVTARGDVQPFYVNSPSSQTLLLNIHTLPKYVPSEFTTTILFTVVNNMSSNNVLYNLTPIVNATAIGTATINELSGPNPSSYPSLGPGEIATFEYDYQLIGDIDEGATFNATIANAVYGNFVTTTALIKEVTIATQAGTSIESFGLSTSLISDNNVLYFHDETDLTPGDGYPMDGSDPSGGGTTGNPETATMTFWSSNVTSNTVIVNGTWNSRLAYYSDLVPAGITSPSFAFMFECDECGGTGDTSESTGNISDHDFDDNGNPIWSSVGGPDDDAYYTFDGNGDYLAAEWDAGNEYTTYQDIQSNAVSTAVWFRIPPTDENYMPIVRWGDENDDDDEYEIALGDKTAGNHATIVYRYTTDEDDDETRCISSNTVDYDDNQWHFAIGSRSADDDCDLYVDGVLADGTPQCINGPCSGTGSVNINDENDIFVAHDGQNEYLTGDVAMFMHWNNVHLSSTNVSDLYYTNYGVNGTRPHFTIERTTGTGTVQETIYDDDFELYFHDPAKNSDNTRYDSQTSDSTYEKYSFYNFTTTTLSNSTFAIGERLKFEISWDSDTQNLPINIRFDDDDSGFTLPDESSYIQPPTTEPVWPTYITFDRDDEVTYYAFNNGPEGAWFTYQGTRFVLTTLDNSAAYGAIVMNVNSTDVIDEDQDSIYIPDQNYAAIQFHQLSNPPKTVSSLGERIPVGSYDAAIFLSGYDDNGKSFLRTINLGVVTVTD